MSAVGDHASFIVKKKARYMMRFLYHWRGRTLTSNAFAMPTALFVSPALPEVSICR